MKLAPRMIQSMEILQMPLMQLEERIEQELESNIALELADPTAAEPDSSPNALESSRTDGDQPLDFQSESASDDFARLDSFGESNPEAVENEFEQKEASSWEERDVDRRAEFDVRQSSGSGDTDSKAEAMANTAARSETLTEQLHEQWHMADVDPALRPFGDLIISHIDDDGYLRTPMETIADRSPPSVGRPAPEDLERALHAVQLILEPAGVAARSTRECLLLQLDAIEANAAGDDWRVVRQLVESHLEDLAQNRLPKIAEQTGLTVSDIKGALEKMRTLSLAPARALVDEPSRPIIPDAIVEFDPDGGEPGEGGRYIAYLNDSRLPALRVNREYAIMSKDKLVPKQTRDFLKANLANATWLLDAMEQRRRTLLRVINIVVEAQRDYFDYGPQALKPLPMTQVAEQLGIHVATVSRAVAEKHLLTPRGIVPLRSFFTGGTQTESGEEVSWDAIKAALQEVIEAEDKSKPMSDDALADELKRRGIEIARRTVAKYRDQLNIPSARLRKTYS